MINAASLQMVMGGYIYYLSKFLELFDTIFFVMRKRFDQVSTLHVIHHGIMPFASESKLGNANFNLIPSYFMVGWFGITVSFR